MSRNLIILADGTGQEGVAPDGSRSNIYKVFLGAGPLSNINPNEQDAFYDAGVGTNDGGKPWLLRRVWNAFCQATGLGLTRNIIDCYAEILNRYRDGDELFLLGFSRGAYTVRCVATVIRLCGVPTQALDGSPLAGNRGAARKIATEAVKHVYQFAFSSRDKPYDEVRQMLAEKFRREHSSDKEGEPNVAPRFVGVFDTVAAIGARELVTGTIVVAAAALGLLWWFFGTEDFLTVVVWISIAIVSGFLLFYLPSHIKIARGLAGEPWARRVRILPPLHRRGSSHRSFWGHACGERSGG